MSMSEADAGLFDNVSYDEEADVYRVDSTTVREQGPSLSIILGVAEITDTDPNEQEPLNDVIDPEALDGLFARTTPSGGETDCTSFTYAGFRVTVYRDGEVLLQPRDPASVRNAAD